MVQVIKARACDDFCFRVSVQILNFFHFFFFLFFALSLCTCGTFCLQIGPFRGISCQGSSSRNSVTSALEIAGCEL